MNISFINREIWTDTDGNPLHAHGGSVHHFGDRYYWYGENKKGCFRSANVEKREPRHAGINCYSSCDLYNWQFEATVIQPRPDDWDHVFNPYHILDRPHVLYNAPTKTYVMWMKLVSRSWKDQRVGIATAPTPVGPFTFIKELFPNGMFAGDANLIADPVDGKGYYIFGRPHTEIVVADLTTDYLDTTGMYSCHFPFPGPPEAREAPAVFKRGHEFYMITSGTTSYGANPADWSRSPLIHGPWISRGNPCTGTNAENTFDAQFTAVFEVQDRPGCFIGMADRWHQNDITKSSYVWLPLRFDAAGDLSIPWREEWDLSVFD